jgi:hypothetical protein
MAAVLEAKELLASEDVCDIIVFRGEVFRSTRKFSCC